MKITIQVQNKPVEIELTDEQIQLVKKHTEKVTDRIKTFEDVLADHDISEDTFSNMVYYYELNDKAFRKVKMMVKSLVGDWVPDWTDGNQKKWFPYFNMNDASGFGFSHSDYDYWLTYTTVGSRLCFPTQELAEYAGKQFTELYRDLLK